MVKRKIIKIDESKCTGCGDCITACAEGAIELKGGKARVVSDSFCDGLGACLAVCPAGALTIEERETEEFDETAVKKHQRQKKKEIAVSPCTAPVSLTPATTDGGAGRPETGKAGAQMEIAQLSNWPIQMRLVRPGAPYLQGASLLVAADCTAFAYPGIQKDFIKGRVTLVGCPKLDETEPFINRLAEILKANDIKDITVLHMTVPCCSQLDRLVLEANKRSGKKVPVESYVVGIEGNLIKG
jgi:Pyruvate/2-oxoacid:ferredoxin oxidoreductase delta subunit